MSLDRFHSFKPLQQKSLERVAVIIPVHNITAFLEEAVRSAVMQDYLRKEIIVIDDGSHETASAEIGRICSMFNDVTLLRQEHKGTAATRDAGIAHTSAEFIYFLDGDDILQPGAITYLATALHFNPEAVATYAKLLYIDEQGTLLGERHFPALEGRDLLYALLERRPCLSNGSVCIRKAALKKLSVDNHGIEQGEDWMLWCHLALTGHIIPAGPQAVVACRNHTRNVSLALKNHYLAALEALNGIYTHPAFIAAVGKDRINELKEKGLSRLHMTLAQFHGRAANPEQAAYHIGKITTSLIELPEYNAS